MAAVAFRPQIVNLCLNRIATSAEMDCQSPSCVRATTSPSSGIQVLSMGIVGEAAAAAVTTAAVTALGDVDVDDPLAVATIFRVHEKRRLSNGGRGWSIKIIHTTIENL